MSWRGDVAILTVLLALSACSDLPRDPEDTSARVRAEKIIRLGEVAGAPKDAAAEAALQRLAVRTGARVERTQGHGEELLEGLEEGKFDLVYGHFADDSPWARHVHFGTPPAGPKHPAKSQRVARFAFRMGENGWLSMVEAAGK